MQYVRTHSTRGGSTVATISALLLSACALGHDDIDGEISAEVVAVPPAPETVDAESQPAEVEAEPAAEKPAPKLGAKLGRFELTYYWMAREAKNKGQTTVQLYNRQCKPLVKVTKSFAARLAVEGTGTLRDGRVVNTTGSCDCETSCFFLVPRSKRWGVGVGKRPLSPFRTVAVDPKNVRIGTMLYIPELDGLTMPGRKPWGGFVHDGCVIAGDRGGGVQGRQLDFFTGRRTHYQSLYRRHRLRSVTVYNGKGRCEKRGRSVVAVNRNSI